MDYPMSAKGWVSEAQQFGEALGHVSNYSYAYLLAMFYALSGHLIGRRAFIRYATPLYPNHYVCLVGPSAVSHKSTAMKLGLESVSNHPIHVMSHITTPQGLLMGMSENGGEALVVLDEIANMLAQKRMDASKNLIASLTELYGCPTVAGTYTRHQPIKVDEPYLTLVAGSTIEWLQSTLTVSDMMGGFGNRMTFVVGDPRSENSWPRQPFLDDLDWSPLFRFSGQVFLEEEARDLWDEFYAKFSAHQQHSPPFIRVLAERIPEKILKAALVVAVWRNTKYITPDILDAAIDWGRYIRKGLERLAPAFQEVEHQVVQAVREGHNTKSKLFAALSHSTETRRLREAISNAEWLGHIRLNCDGTEYEVRE